MIAIKIQCGCGQKYAFDTEPVDGRMSYTIACPVCGADGTSAANMAIAQALAAQPAMAVAGGVPFQSPPLPTAAPVFQSPPPPSAAPVYRAAPPAMEAAPSAPSGVPASRIPKSSTLMPGQIPKHQAEVEARAKIFWGDAQEEVVKFMMIHNFTYAEATPLVQAMFEERCVTIRQNGITKIWTGVLMVCVPVGGWIGFNAIHFMPMKIFGFMCMIGLWGAYRIVKGIIMVISPKTEPGDVASQ